MKFISLQIATLTAICLASGCNEKKASATNPAASEQNDLKKMRAELSTPNGSSAFADLHHKGIAGFEELHLAFANSEISPDNYISWVYDLETRWSDGSKLNEDFEKFQFEKADKDDLFANKLADFYKSFSRGELETLSSDQRLGASKVAKIALEKKGL